MLAFRAMDEADATLVAAARNGDRQATEALLARHEQQIYRFGLRMCGDEDAAREVLQETMLAAFRNLPGFRGEASPRNPGRWRNAASIVSCSTSRAASSSPHMRSPKR